MDFLKLTSTNHKLHLADVRLHIWPSVQGDISLRQEPFAVSQAKNLALSNFSRLVPWNSSTPCFLTKSIGALGAVSQSKTLAISREIFNNASVDTCSLLAESDGLETDGSRSIRLTLSVVSSITSWDWSILVNIQNNDIRIRPTQYYVGTFLS